MNKQTDVTTTIWRPTNYRFVAFLDILAFRLMVEKTSHKELYEVLEKIYSIQGEYCAIY